MTNTLKKDFYNSLGLKNSANRNQIDAAYQSLSSKYHPDRNPNDRLGAQKKFDEVTQAYINLSDAARRHQYDVLTTCTYTLEDANKVFNRFYEDKGISGEEQKLFFKKHFPQKQKSYYQILDVKRNAHLDQIKKAYKNLALKYHPKANPGDKQAQKNFIQISEAYDHLSDPAKRNIYNVSLSGEIKPHVAHKIYQGYNALKQSEHKALNSLNPETQFAESYTQSYYTQKTPFGVIGKAIRHKSSFQNGKKCNIATEQILKPDGSREVTETRDLDGKVQTKKYNIPKGQQSYHFPLIHSHQHRELQNQPLYKQANFHKDNKQSKQNQK